MTRARSTYRRGLGLYADHYPEGRFFFRDLEPYVFSPPLSPVAQEEWDARIVEQHDEVSASESNTPNTDLVNGVWRGTPLPDGYAFAGLGTSERSAPMLNFNALSMLSMSRRQFATAKMTRAKVAQGLVSTRMARVTPEYNDPLLDMTRLFRPNADYEGTFDGLGGLGGLGYLGAIDAGAGLQFAKDETAKDFLNGKGLSAGCDARGGVFRAIPPAIYGQIVQRVADLDNLGDAGISAWRAKAQSYIAECDRLQTHDQPITITAFLLPWETGPQLSRCGRTDAREAQYYAALTQLKAHVMSALNLQPTAAAAPLQLPPTPNQPYPLPQGSIPQTQYAPPAINYASYFPQTGSSSSGLNIQKAVAEPGAIPWVPIAVGGGILVLGGAALLMMKKKR